MRIFKETMRPPSETQSQVLLRMQQFPCRNLARIDARYKEHYRTSFIENLNFKKQHSLTAFIERENRKWQCTQCGAELCCHNGICYNCSVDHLQTMKKWYRWEDDQ